MGEKKKLVLIDGHALAYRAYFALQNTGFQTREGEPTHAVYGFALMLLATWDEIKPDYIAAAFDTGRTFRHRQYPEYKATREKSPEDMQPQMERICGLVEAFNIPIFTAEDYEADDVLGTLSAQASEQGIETIIVTGDRDAFQLVGPDVKVLISGRRFGDRELYDEEKVREKYGLEPAKLIELKGLMGDTSDNIPGVKGIGEKTGTKLLRKYGTLEEIYNHLDDLNKSVREKLEAENEEAFLSRALGRIVRDVPGVVLDLAKCRTHDYDANRVRDLFHALEFKSLLDRLPESAGVAASGVVEEEELPAEAAPYVPGADDEGYYVVTDAESLRALAGRLEKAPAISFDVETTSLDPLEAALVGISLGDGARRGYYVPVAVGRSSSPAQLSLLDVAGEEDEGGDRAASLPPDTVTRILRPVLENEKTTKYAHNAKYDVLVLRRHGIEVRGPLFDTMLAAWLLNPVGSVGLKELAWSCLRLEMTHITDLIGRGRDQVTIDMVPISKVAPYACADADVTFRLAGHFGPELRQKQMWGLFTDLEIPLVPILADMQEAGICLDRPVLEQMSVDMGARLEELETRIHEAAGHPFNVNSTQQLSDVLFKELKLPTEGLKKTKSGHYSTAASVLEGLEDAHEIMGLILEQRMLAKLKSTYVDALPAMVRPQTGRLHTSFNQTGTSTGRLSSSDPNLQNIPIRTEEGREVRRAFVAGKGCVLLSADYSQIELRIMAHMADAAELKEAFARGLDIHASTASTILGIPIEDVTKEQRRLAKAVNFGLAYGQTAFGLARGTDLDRRGAQEFIDRYFERYPGVQAYIESTKELAARQSYVETLMGRRRYFPNLARLRGPERARLEREAINMPIQGTAADIIKIAMINLQRELDRRRLRSRQLLQIHDELLLEVPRGELDEVAALTREVMEAVTHDERIELSVFLKVDVEAGDNWLEMEEL